MRANQQHKSAGRGRQRLWRGKRQSDAMRKPAVRIVFLFDPGGTMGSYELQIKTINIKDFSVM